MAPLPPTIPTSFVPKQQVAQAPRRKKSGMNMFMLIAVVIFVTSLLGAGAIFGYQFYLQSARDSKQASLAEAQKAINLEAVEEFIRLKNRLSTAQSLLNQHVYLSAFLEVLEQRTLQSVTFNTLRVTVAEDRTAEIQMEGTARTFNALASQSSVFASEKRIRRAIFSNISGSDTGTVSFSFTATLDPRLITGQTATGVMPAATLPEQPTAPIPNPELPTGTEPAAATGTPSVAPSAPQAGPVTPPGQNIAPSSTVPGTAPSTPPAATGTPQTL